MCTLLKEYPLGEVPVYAWPVTREESGPTNCLLQGWGQLQLQQRDASIFPPPLRVPGASEGESILDISLQNTFLPRLTVSFTGLLQHWVPYLLDVPETQSKDNMYWYSNNMTDDFLIKVTQETYIYKYRYTHVCVCVYIYIFIHIWRRRQWHPTPVLLPGKSHGWRSLVGCSPWGH